MATRVADAVEWAGEVLAVAVVLPGALAAACIWTATGALSDRLAKRSRK